MKVFRYLLLVLVLCGWTHGNANNGPTTVAALKVGAGGFLRNIYIASDGTMVTRADTMGCWTYNAAATNPGNAGGSGAWGNVVTATSMPTADWTPGDAHGCEEIIAYDATRIYVNYNGFVYYSGNAGLTFTRGTGFTKDAIVGGSQQTFSNLIAVDNQNPDFVMASSSGNQIFISSNATSGASATWTGVSTASVPAGDQMGVCVDPQSTITGGKRQTWYAWSQGNGVYKTTNGGSTWASTSSQTTIKGIRCDASGNVWLYNDTTSLYKYNGTSWSTQTPGITVHAFASNPSNSAAICVAGGGFAIACSTNTGVAWVSSTNWTILATDIPWLATVQNEDSVGGLSFDGSGNVWLSEGVGVFKTTPIASNNVAYNYTSVSAAIEQLVANWAVSSPSCPNPTVFSWDRAAFQVNRTSYPTTQPIKLTPQPIIGGWGADWASANPSTIVTVANSNQAIFQEISGFSSDCGATFTPFGPSNATSVTVGTGSKSWTGVNTTLAITVSNDIWIYRASDNSTYMHGTVTAYTGGTLTVNVADTNGSGTFTDWIIHAVPPGMSPGGMIAAASSSCMIMMGGNFGAFWTPWRTLDGGVHWVDTGSYFNTNFGIPLPPSNSGWDGAHFSPVQRGNTAADRVSANTLYTYNYLASGSGGGFYKTTDCGQTWAKQSAGTPSGQLSSDLALLKAVPGNAGHLFFSDRLGEGLTRSTDGGQTWTAVSNVNHIFAFGFGAIFPGQTYPAIYIVGYVGSVTNANYGVWRSIDNASTWSHVINFPNNVFFYVSEIDGDKTTFGSFYGALQGMGFFYGHL